MINGSSKKLQVWLPLLLSITMILGMMLGYRMKESMPGKKFFSIDKSYPLQEVLDLIKNKYVDSVNIRKLTDTAITAMLGKLDPHTVLIPAEDLQQINEDIAGNFFGIGIEFEIFDDTINVLNVLPDGPAFKAGLMAGDKLIKVNDSSFVGRKLKETRIMKMLRGGIGTEVNVQVLRKNELKTFKITRGIIPMSSVDAAYMMSPGLGYIRLNKFSQVTYREFMEQLEKLKNQGLQQLILDLRGNGGGVLDQATEIADEFLDGDKLITYTEGTHFPKKEYRCKRNGLFETGKLVVLADEGSASASEILIGALQDWNRATIVGRRTFGKGLVQEQYDLSDGSALRLTISRYYTPVGRSIQRPYSSGEKAYYEEIIQRYHNGEIATADSLKYDTTKKYKTPGGKIVYGGGGITPDVYVPLDTLENYNFLLGRLYNKGTITAYAYQYFLNNPQKFNGVKDAADFSKNFQLTGEEWNQFKTRALKDSFDFSNISLKEKLLLELRIKSAIARQKWRTQGYYLSLNTGDEVIKKAVELLSK